MIGKTNATTIIGGTTTGHRVRFVYPDGTIAGDQIVPNGCDAVVPTSHPTITNCTFYGWNQATTNITHPREIGAIYRTTETGKSYFVVEVSDKSGLSGMQMTISNISNPFANQWSIDWGDGEVYTSTAAGFGITVSKTNPYPTNGTYTIVFDATNINAFSMSGTVAPLNAAWNIFVKQINFSEKLYTATLSQTNLKSLEVITLGSTGMWNINSTGTYSLKSLIFNSNCNSVSIENGYSLKAISFPDGISFTINSIKNCYLLERIIFPSNQTNSTLTSLSFEGNINITDLWIPSAVTYLPRFLVTSPLIRTFDLSQFTTLNTGGSNLINSGLLTADVSQFTSIPYRMFYNNYNLETVTLPTTTSASTTLGGQCFYQNYKLRSVNIPNNITIIDQYCFYFCIALLELDLPSTVTTFNQFALYLPYNLNKLICRATTPPTLGANALMLLEKTKIYVPDASVAAYKAASGWSTYSTQIYPLSTL